MAKKFNSGLCVHCLKETSTLTSDHLLPQSWYPLNEKENFEKWQIPSCQKCNSEYGKLENDLLLFIGHCVDPKNKKSEGITNKVIRARSPKFAKNEKDGLHRQSKKEKILKRLVKVENTPKESLFPKYGIDDKNSTSFYGVLIPKRDIELFGEKIVRGITYIAHSTFIDPEYEISIIFQHDENIADVIDQIHKFGKKYECGKAIKIWAAFVQQELPCGMFEIEVWGRLKMYGFVEPKKISQKQS